MEASFTSYVAEELRTLLSDIESGLQPSNIVLQEVVFHHLRKQFERENPRGRPAYDAVGF